MKNLELNGLSLQELNSKELLSVKGGGGIWGAIAGWAGGHFADALAEAVIADYRSRPNTAYSASARLRNFGPY